MDSCPAHPYFAICAVEPKNELPAAECAAITGARPEEDGFAVTASLWGIERAAYVRFGARFLAADVTLDGLVKQISTLTIDSDAFRIELSRLPGAPRFDSQEAIVATADAFLSHPNLSNPRHRFALIARSEGFWFGEIEKEADGGWRRHEEKPYRTSSSLSPRMARALINLVAGPQDTVLNPCCGTGSLLLESAAIGAEGFGVDRNQRMVGMTRLNLAYFGYGAGVERSDARDWQQTGDALVADLPYNRNNHAPRANTQAILARAAKQAPRAVFVAGEDLTDALYDCGFCEVNVHQVFRSRITRFVHMARTK